MTSWRHPPTGVDVERMDTGHLEIGDEVTRSKEDAVWYGRYRTP